MPPWVYWTFLIVALNIWFFATSIVIWVRTNNFADNDQAYRYWIYINCIIIAVVAVFSIAVDSE